MQLYKLYTGQEQNNFNINNNQSETYSKTKWPFSYYL